jgi:hypothetical protein
MRCERTSQYGRRAQPSRRRTRVERAELDTELAGLGHLSVCPLKLRLRPGYHDGATDSDVRVDALGTGHAHHFGQRVVHCRVLRHGRLAPSLARQRCGTDREQCRAPTTVTSGRPEAGVLLLYQGDP